MFNHSINTELRSSNTVTNKTDKVLAVMETSSDSRDTDNDQVNEQHNFREWELL